MVEELIERDWTALFCHHSATLRCSKSPYFCNVTVVRAIEWRSLFERFNGSLTCSLPTDAQETLEGGIIESRSHFKLRIAPTLPSSA